MEVTDLKTWLQRGIQINKDINKLQLKKSRAEQSVINIVRPLKKQIAKGTPSRNDESLINYADNTNDYDLEIAECKKLLDEISFVISIMNGLIYRTVLVGKYVNCCGNENIADEIGCSERHMNRIHNEAINKLADEIEDYTVLKDKIMKQLKRN